MIVVDASALIAILFREPEAEDFAALIQANRRAIVPAPAAVELRMVALGQRGLPGDAEAIELLRTLPLEVVAFEPEHVDAALRAFERYGKSRHPAKLNFGDCMVYALAHALNARLLFKGDDFRKTDIIAVTTAFQ